MEDDVDKGPGPHQEDDPSASGDQPAAKRPRVGGDQPASDLRAKALAMLNAQRAKHAGAMQEQPDANEQHLTEERSPPEDDPEGGASGRWDVEQADEGQNFDDLLAADELHWESTHSAGFLPPGWGKCPNMGSAVLGVGIIPIKTPIGGHRGQHIPKPYQWRPNDVVTAFEERGMRIGMVIDLTSTSKYYGPAEFTRHGVEHVKIPCRGHGELPQPADVNRFYWEVARYSFVREHLLRQEEKVKSQYDADVAAYEQALAAGEAQGDAGAVAALKHPRSKLSKAEQTLLDDKLFAKPRVIAVHCTHGYNRTGFMITHYLMRFSSSMTVSAAIAGFAQARAPGIYKDDYIQGLFEYYHEERQDEGPQASITPLMPVWKPDEGSPEHFLATEDPVDAAGADPGEGRTMHHDDNIGEALCEDEVNMWKDEIIAQIKLAWLEGMRARGRQGNGIAEEEYERQKQKCMNGASKQFPGSQPVSLQQSNEHLICAKRYWFTWKADGTRYMMYIHNHGTFLIDRRLQVSRVQARFPIWVRDSPQAKPKLKPDHVHRGTLLDGEMVVDTRADGSQHRVFYVYDLMVLNGKNVVMRPWKERFQMILEVVAPRDYEKKLIADRKVDYPRRYAYDKELFAVRRKEFWPLHRVDSVFKNFIPALEHENDGLILQAYETEYCPDRCDELLKWKPSSHNSVDFQVLRPGDGVAADEAEARRNMAPGQKYLLGVLDRGSIRVAYLYKNVQTRKGAPAVPRPTRTPAQIRFPDDVDPEALVNVIVECNWDAAAQVWCFMRDRSKDKTTPNAVSTYTSVVQSIFDCIEVDGIKERFKCAYAMGGDVYKKDRDREREEIMQRQKQAHARP